MGLWDRIRGEFIDIIEWTDDTTDTMVYRFERHGNEIKNDAKLVVRESQAAVFVNEGQFADVFDPGTHTLNTKNLPILSTLQGWKYGFESPFKAEVYFVNTKRFVDQKWGTANPIMMRDADFGLVRVRAFGTYSMRVKDPAMFLKEVVGTNWEFTTEDIQSQMRSFVVNGFTDALGQNKVPVLDLVGRYGELGKQLEQAVNASFGEHGLELLNLVIENVSVPPEVEAAIDKRSAMGAVGNLQAYTQFQAAESLTENPGGMAGMGAQMAAGMAVGQQMAAGMQGGQAPPPVPPKLQYHVAVNGQQQGPYSIETLTTMVSQGTLAKDTLVWTQGMANWQAAGEVAALTSLFANVPPPIPGQ
jgi:membrane protease subunit (stomatin/prohibitin family)